MGTLRTSKLFEQVYTFRLPIYFLLNSNDMNTRRPIPLFGWLIDCQNSLERKLLVHAPQRFVERKGLGEDSPSKAIRYLTGVVTIGGTALTTWVTGVKLDTHLPYACPRLLYPPFFFCTKQTLYAWEKLRTTRTGRWAAQCLPKRPFVFKVLAQLLSGAAVHIVATFVQI
jgi:hypothetical protein